MMWGWLFSVLRYPLLILGAVGAALAALARARSQGRAQERQRQLEEEARRKKVREQIDAEVSKVDDSDLDDKLASGGWLRK